MNRNTWATARQYPDGERTLAGIAGTAFILHYQPQHTPDTREIVGAEALVRLVPEGVKLVPPGDFIRIAEENGFIVPLAIGSSAKLAGSCTRTFVLKLSHDLSPRRLR